MCNLHVCCSSVSQQQAILQDAKILQQMTATGMVSQKEKRHTALRLAFFITVQVLTLTRLWQCSGWYYILSHLTSSAFFTLITYKSHATYKA